MMEEEETHVDRVRRTSPRLRQRGNLRAKIKPSVNKSMHALRRQTRAAKHLQAEMRFLGDGVEDDDDDDDDDDDEKSDEKSDDRATKKKTRRRREREREHQTATPMLFPFQKGRKKTRENTTNNPKTSIRKQTAENIHQLVALCLQRGEFKLAAKATAALLAISRKRKYREEEDEDGWIAEQGEDEDAKKKRRVRKTMAWTHKVGTEDVESLRKHERLAMKSCLELMSGGGETEEGEEERDAQAIYANLVKEAKIGGAMQEARFERAFGELFRATRRKVREAKKRGGHGKELSVVRMAKMMKKNQKNKALPRARFGGYDMDEEEEEEEEEKEIKLNIEPELTEAVRVLEGRGVGVYNFHDNKTKNLLRSSMRSLTDAAMLKVVLWFESVKDDTVRRNLRRLEMCRAPLTSKEIEMKRRGQSIVKTVDARAKSGAFGDNSQRTHAFTAVSGLLEARAANNATNSSSSSSLSSSNDAIKLSIAKVMLILSDYPTLWEDPETTIVAVDEVLQELVQEHPNDKDAREALATFLIRAYALGYRKNQADGHSHSFRTSDTLDCMDAHNISNACFGTLRVNPTCEIATRFLMRCWKYNCKAVDAQLVEGVYFLEDALDDDYIRDMNNTDDFSALDSGSAEYIGSAIDVNELLHAACERVECLPGDEMSWKYLSTALLGIETFAGESPNAYTSQYEIIFHNVSKNRAWWPERMFANQEEISPSNIALCELKAVVACIAFPLDERCKRYVDTFRAFLSKNPNVVHVSAYGYLSVSSTKPLGIGSLLSFLKNRVKKKYKHLFTSDNVSHNKGRVAKSDKDDIDDELKDVQVDDAML